MPQERGTKIAPGINELPDGRLKIRVTATDPATRKRVEAETTLPATATLPEARRERRLLREQLKNNLSRPRPSGSVEDYAIEWLTTKTDLKPGTFEWYADTIADFIIPHIGSVSVHEVSRATAREWVASVDALPGYSKSTRQGWWNVCKQMLLDLKADLGIPDPTDRVRGPKRHDPAYRRERGALTRDELAEFMQAFRERYEHRFPEVVMLATTGMRSGEMYGLMWDCVHFDQSRLHIKRSASQGVLTDSTKSGEPRNAPLWPSLAESLKAIQKEQWAEHHPGLRLNLVFPSNNGTPRGSGSIRKPMKIVAAELGLDVKVGPQVLRRTVNTQLRAAGIDETVVLQQIGHADTAMGLHYARHETTTMLAAMEGVFEGVFTP